MLARPLDGVVSLGQIVEMGDDVAHPLRRIARFEHVVTHEIVEVAHGLQRDRLVKQLEGLFRSNSKQATQRRCVFGEFIEDFRSGGPQPLAQITQVGTEVGEVRRDRQLFCRDDEEAVGLSGALALLEDLGQGDRLVIAMVGENSEDHRVRAPVLAQSLGAGLSGGLIPLRLVVAFNVGAQGAFPGLGAGGLVVGGLVGRHQQCGECVDDRRLARADITGEQRGIGGRAEPPDLGVERTPVQHLRVLQTVTDPSGVPECGCGRRCFTHHWSTLRRTPAAWPQSPTGSGRRRRP